MRHKYWIFSVIFVFVNTLFAGETEDRWTKNAKYLCSEPDLSIGIWPVFYVSYFEEMQNMINASKVSAFEGCERNIKFSGSEMINIGKPCALKDTFEVGSSLLVIAIKLPESVKGEFKTSEGIRYLIFNEKTSFEYEMHGNKLYYGGKVSHMCQRVVEGRYVKEILIEFKNFREPVRAFARFRPVE